MRKKITLPILFAIFVFLHAYSHQPENVCPGNVTLTTQSEVNAFSCSVVDGTLRISGSDITDLSPLSVLQKVGTGLEIQNNLNLTNLDGLSSLTTISGPGSTALTIADNPALINVNGLSSLRDFGWTTSGHITIRNNAVLEDLTGLLALRAPLNANQSLFIDLTDNPTLDCGAFVRFFQSLGLEVVNELYSQGKILTEESGICTFEGILSSYWGEECTYGNITLSSQAEVDAFYCPEVGGILKISGDNITDLTPLARLQKVGQELIIENNPNLTTLDGLSALDSIVGSSHIANLTIRNNASLQNIDALASLTYVGVPYSSDITITDNPVLQNIDGLSSLSTWFFSRYGSLTIKNNASLENIDGLTSMRLEGGASFGLRVTITNNPSLTTCTGITPFLKNLESWELEDLLGSGGVVVSDNGSGCTLEDILSADPPESCEGDMILSSQAEVDAFTCTTVKGLLKISGEDITNLSALSILRKVSGGLSIRDNPNLTNLNGLSSLDSIEGGITLRNNASLTNVDGLSSLHYFQGNRFNGLVIVDNPALQNLNGFSSLIHFGGPKGAPIYIADNAALESIHGLSMLRAPDLASDAYYYISIIRNSSLMECGALFPFLQTLGEEVISRSDIEIVYNGGGCTLESFFFGFPYNEVCLGNITLSSQAEVDAFYCQEVEGILTISGEDITDLSALANLRRIGAGLTIENNPNLTTLEGLSALDSINGDRPSRHLARLIIRNNASLVNVDGLSSFNIIHANSFTDLIITDNPSLQNLNGLSSLSIFDYGKGGTIDISNNAVLSSIDGLSGLSLANISLPNSLNFRIVNNPMLILCTGLLPVLQTLEEAALYDLISLGQIQIKDNGDGCSLEDIIADGKPFLANFSLFDINLDLVVTENFYDSITLDIAQVDFINWTIQANTYPEEIGSVVFVVDNKIKLVDNKFPYRLNRFIVPLLKLGTHTIRTEVYSKRNGRGEKGLGRTAVITIINSATVSDFEVVDTSGNLLMKLNDGDEINIQDPAFQSFSVKANVGPYGQVHHVKFWLNKKLRHIDSSYPYSINGDKNGQYKPWEPGVGTYTLRATPYSRTLIKTYAGQSLEVRFKVVSESIGSENQIIADKPASPQASESGSEDISVTLYPVPVGDELFVQLTNDNKEVTVCIKNIQGLPVYTHRYGAQQLNGSGINTSGLKPGVYLVQVSGNNGFLKILKFIKR